MDIRRLVLRLSLICLGVTAISAIGLALLPAVGVASRVTVTGIAATITGLICLPFARWASRDDLRWGGLAGIVFMCTEFMLVLALAWGSYFFPQASGQAISGTIADVFFVALPCIAGARALGGAQRVAGATALACGLASLVLLQVDTWFYAGMFAAAGGPNPSDFGVTLRGLGMTLLVAGSAASLGLVTPRVPRPRWPIVATLLAIVAGGWFVVLVSQGLVWNDWDPIERVHGAKGALSIVFVAFTLGGANLLMRPKIGEQAWLVQLATVGVAGIACATGIVALWTEDEQFFSAFVASTIAILCGIVAITMIAKFRQEPVLSTDGSILPTVDLVCPRCRCRGTVALGDSSCAFCGLRFRIAVEEPRCARCGQLLVGSKGDRCPECGRPIAELPSS
ncbi:MAG: hypothetical protein U0572_17275 [Phycisphaerales bacterium]